MIVNREKLGHAVTFMKYLASVVPSILPKIVNWSEIRFPQSNSIRIKLLNCW